MKTRLIILFAILISFELIAENKPNSPDCDVCSTSTSTSTLGFDLNTRNHIGLNFFYQNYNSKNGIFKNSEEFKEHYRTLFLSGNINITKTWNINFGIPFQMHSRAIKDGSVDQFETGMGDITLQSFYTVFKSDSVSKSPITVRFGAGGKMPISKYKSDNGLSRNPNFNLGSGSWDFNLGTQINWIFNTKGINAQINYTWKTENKKSFKFGNQLDISLLYFQTFKWMKDNSFTFLSGIRGEWFEKNRQTGYDVEGSQGHAKFLQIGLDFPFKNFNIGSMLYVPIEQKLMEDRLKVNSRALCYVKWLF